MALGCRVDLGSVIKSRLWKEVIRSSRGEYVISKPGKSRMICYTYRYLRPKRPHSVLSLTSVGNKRRFVGYRSKREDMRVGIQDFRGTEIIY